jgi:hypothetical protein
MEAAKKAISPFDSGGSVGVEAGSEHPARANSPKVTAVAAIAMVRGFFIETPSFSGIDARREALFSRHLYCTVQSKCAHESLSGGAKIRAGAQFRRR